MITAHLPSGYVLAKLRWPTAPAFWAAVLGAVAPDFDMIWFYLVDSSLHHHRFFPHIPAFWLAMAVPVLAFWRGPITYAFFAGLTLHLLLDSLSGGILWLWPVSDHLFHLVTVPAKHSWWVWNFILHWTFLAELAIWAWAVLLFWTTSKNHIR